MEQPQSLAVFEAKPDKERTSVDQVSEGDVDGFWGGGIRARTVLW